jgi:hypothetical protein
MLARSGIIRIAGGSLGCGLLVGAAVAVLTPGAASTQATATTTSSTTTTTSTVPTVPSTTSPTDAAPVVLEFVATPADPACVRGESRTRVVLTWSSQDADSVSIDADGTAVVVDAGPTGRRSVALDCPAAGETETHDFQLTATAADGGSASKSATVTVVGSTTGRGRGGPPDDQG